MTPPNEPRFLIVDDARDIREPLKIQQQRFDRQAGRNRDVERFAARIRAMEAVDAQSRQAIAPDALPLFCARRDDSRSFGHRRRDGRACRSRAKSSSPMAAGTRLKILLRVDRERQRVCRWTDDGPSNEG